MSSEIIRCIHEGIKTRIMVEYNGIEKTLSACPDCMDVIEVSNRCKILEVLND